MSRACAILLIASPIKQIKQNRTKNDKSYVPCDNSGKSHPRYSLASAKAWYRTLIFPINQSEKKGINALSIFKK